MACYRPVAAWRHQFRLTETGKAFIVFKAPLVGEPYEEILLPCGKCVGCRVNKAREWALRCVHEASCWTYNCFVTLTFDDDHAKVSLVKRDFQLFMKRLRKRFRGLDEYGGRRPIRYFHCGEYGAKNRRAHHHACIFNFDFLDKELWSTRGGVKLFRSAALEELWPFGYSLIGEVNFESACYVAKYVAKKCETEVDRSNGPLVDESTGEVMLKEYITMSRRPGVGRLWFERFGSDVYPKDFITEEGQRFKPPRYYDKVFSELEPELFESVKASRLEEMIKVAADNTPRRRSAKEKVAKSFLRKSVRSYEDVD